MPEGVEVVVAEGFATIDFTDGSKRGPGLDALLKIGTPPEAIEKLTRSGPRALYVVPEGNAREAGLLDEVSQVDALEQPDTSSATDATGAVPPEFPSTLDLHAQTIRSGSYSGEYANGGLIIGSTLNEDSVPVQLDSSYVIPSVQVSDTATFAELNELVEPAAETPSAPKGYDDGLPDMDWSRPALNAYAKKAGIEGADKLPNRAAVLAAIKEAQKSS